MASNEAAKAAMTTIERLAGSISTSRLIRSWATWATSYLPGRVRCGRCAKLLARNLCRPHFFAPRAQSPEEAAKILNRERQGQRARNAVHIPEDANHDRNERAVEQRGKDESIGIQASADDINHPEAADEHAGEPHVARPLLAERRQVKQPHDDLRRRYRDDALHQVQPTNRFNGFCRASLPMSPNQAVEHLAERRDTHDRQASRCGSCTTHPARRAKSVFASC